MGKGREEDRIQFGKETAPVAAIADPRVSGVDNLAKEGSLAARMPARHGSGAAPVVIAHVIGQTPRPDLTAGLRRRFPEVRFRVVGALDDLRSDEIAPSAPGGYPLETRVRDGSRIVVDAAFVAPLLQNAIIRHDEGASAHLLLCAGPFHGLASPGSPSREATPLIRPFEAAVEQLVEGGYRRLDVLVPFDRQVTPAREKWAATGFSCRVDVISDRPGELTLPAWASELVSEGDAEALVFDYVGFPPATLNEVAARIEVPVFDLGHFALRALEGALDAP